MLHAVSRIAFTPAVRAAQKRMGSLDAYIAASDTEAAPVALGPDEEEFIATRDSFYLGTVSETDWPYVQHRGGPAGFLKVLDSRTIGYADFSGNRQYISVGNIDGNSRMMLFLMDYSAQRRLKIWGRARAIDEVAEPEVIARLESPGYRARVERGFLITVDAFDWNCPKHITPRYTEREFRARLPSRNQAPGQSTLLADALEPLGSGKLSLTVTGMRQLTPRVRAYELRAPDHADLPRVAAGAHIAVPVSLLDGSAVTRQYSLITLPQERKKYEIAVLLEETGRGGSSAIHATWQLGTRLALDLPLNQFSLHRDERPAVLVAGGIGITPIRSMAHELGTRGTWFTLHYSGRTAADMAYLDALTRDFPAQLHRYCTHTPGGTRMDMRSIMREAPVDAVFYVCGPSRMIDAARRTAGELSIAPGRLHTESFE